ncbi:dTDP-4-dehydrorhamnose 3,5-epimerase [Tamlana sp. 62-3]|uniref:dTDP-4-dehydrorhamnose 3,5-epimerase n=1 Tax=Neotamlana sargassicola TaxID=2883125 RepID=A0A9X1I8B2_9FLAO|nr:dTDP-4-dehydrorhamnose 3,5-epimerase [Tamlana sargassicola]MCB4809203.1 dTDP-4-dehydrorhamnose 3,5-epimerase [Tamlana sargassicola]
MLEKIKTEIPGLYILKPKVFSDSRGLFVKIFHNCFFDDLGLRTDFVEEYFSTSAKGVVRGLHFQTPPYQHVKCIICLKGAIFDVVVDLRKNSPTFGKHLTINLKADEPKILYIPEGLAHGFMSLEDDTIFLNKTTTVFDAECDAGIHWNSCGIEWPDIPIILSEKDKNMVSFNNFDSPFK